MIESQCGNGKCYLRIMSALPGYKDCTVSSLEEAIISASLNLGANPLGIDILPELWFANQILLGQKVVATEDVYKTDLVQQMMSSNVRFTWEDLNGIHHIGGFIEEDDCEPIFCNHGWASRFVLCSMIARDVKVGADMDMSQLFNEFIQEEGMDSTPVMRNDSFVGSNNLMSKIDDQNNEIERLNERIQAMQMNSSNHASYSRNHKNREEIDDQMTELLTAKMRQNARKEQETILPNDSSSQIGRYEKKFLDNGTIYNVTGRGKTVLGVQTEIERPTITKNVVCGYVKTKEMEQKERESLSRVAPINGLANPFKNNRLNLLCHFHTAIDCLRPQSDQLTNYDAIKYLSDFKSQTPSEELAFQMISRTFDLKHDVVIANPFKIPFLEVGMIISDDMLAKSLDMLRLEYKMLWFSEMKSMSVPVFHSEYKAHKEYKRTSKSHASEEIATSSTRSYSTKRSSSHRSDKPRTGGKTSTVLSFIRA